MVWKRESKLCRSLRPTFWINLLHNFLCRPTAALQRPQRVVQIHISFICNSSDKMQLKCDPESVHTNIMDTNSMDNNQLSVELGCVDFQFISLMHLWLNTTNRDQKPPPEWSLKTTQVLHWMVHLGEIDFDPPYQWGVCLTYVIAIEFRESADV